MKLKINLYSPHAGQWPLHNSNARFRIASCGRRFGKTLMCVNEIIKYANTHKNVNTVWGAPTYRQSKIAFDMITKNVKGAFKSFTKNPMEILWHNNSVTKFYSTESYDNLRGDSVNFMVLDESAMIEEEAWTNVLRPMLSDTQGKAIITSTPRGMNWFHTLFSRGQDAEYEEYASFKFPTSANPYIPSEEIEEVRRTLPWDVFRQEYLAEFLEDGGQIFRNVSSCVGDTLAEPAHSKDYVLGFDVAKHTDFSVAIVMDIENGNIVALDRFNRIDYSLQVKRVAELAKRYNNAQVLVDSTGVGDPILEQLRGLNINAEGYQFTNTSKQQLIEHLAVLIEKKEIAYPNNKVLINELMSYQYEITRAGNMRYNAPSGQHDDCVIALALASWKMRHRTEVRLTFL